MFAALQVQLQALLPVALPARRLVRLSERRYFIAAPNQLKSFVRLSYCLVKLSFLPVSICQLAVSLGKIWIDCKHELVLLDGLIKLMGIKVMPPQMIAGRRGQRIEFE